MAEHSGSNRSQSKAFPATDAASEWAHFVERLTLCLLLTLMVVLACMGNSAAEEPDGAAANTTVIYSFSPNHALDGVYPSDNLVRDHAGNLYGTTRFGGAMNAGTVFKLDAAGKQSVVYSFCPSWGCADGKSPAGLTQDEAGNLYGVTFQGGTHGAGTVFRIDAAGRHKVLHNFCTQVSCGDGKAPAELNWKGGKLYGVTSLGGSLGAGVAFEMSADGEETVLVSCVPSARCTNPNLVREDVRDAEGNVYGATSIGGVYGYGAVYRRANL